MNQQSEHFSMIIEVLKQLKIKPNKQSFTYADKFIKTHGGYKQYYDSFNQYKMQKERTSISPLTKQYASISTSQNNKTDLAHAIDQEECDLSKNFDYTRERKLSGTHTMSMKAPDLTVLSPKVDNNILKNENSKPVVPPRPRLSPNLDHNSIKASDLFKTTPSLSLESNPTALKQSDSNNQDKSLNKLETGTRNDLLNSIVNYSKELKPVSKTNPQNKVTKLAESTEQNDIINQLFKALNEMRPYLSNILLFMSIS